MKKIITLLVLCFIGSITKAQLPVTDLMANISQKANTALTKTISGLVKLQAEILDNALTEAKKTTKTVDEHLKLVEKIYSNVEGMEDLKRVKEIFQDVQNINSSISILNSFLNDPDNMLSKKDKQTIKRGIDLSLDDTKVALETMKFSLNDQNKLGVGERLKEFESTTNLLERASENLYEGKTIVFKAKNAKEIKDKSLYYYNLKYKKN